MFGLHAEPTKAERSRDLCLSQGGKVCRFGDFELEQLQAEAAAAGELSPGEAGAQAVIEEMGKAIGRVVKVVQTGAQRCMRLTQATELDTFFVIADGCLQTFILSLQVTRNSVSLLGVKGEGKIMHVVPATSDCVRPCLDSW